MQLCSNHWNFRPVLQRKWNIINIIIVIITKNINNKKEILHIDRNTSKYACIHDIVQLYTLTSIVANQDQQLAQVLHKTSSNTPVNGQNSFLAQIYAEFTNHNAPYQSQGGDCLRLLWQTVWTSGDVGEELHSKAPMTFWEEVLAFIPPIKRCLNCNNSSEQIFVSIILPNVFSRMMHL